MSPAPSYVYFVEGPHGHVKIGVTTDPSQRLANLSTGSPIPLRVLAVVEGGRAEEKLLHARHAKDRIAGEWFRRSPHVEATILAAQSGVLEDQMLTEVAPGTEAGGRPRRRVRVDNRRQLNVKGWRITHEFLNMVRFAAQKQGMSLADFVVEMLTQSSQSILTNKPRPGASVPIPSGKPRVRVRAGSAIAGAAA